MARLTRHQHDARDASRRHGRRGVARAVLERHWDASYMDTHPIAKELALTYGTKTIERWATARSPGTDTGKKVFCMGR